MLLLAAAAIVTAQPPAHSAGARPGALTAVATATVRIVSGVRVTAASQPAGALVQTVQNPGSDGQAQLARLVEFQ